MSNLVYDALLFWHLFRHKRLTKATVYSIIELYARKTMHIFCYKYKGATYTAQNDTIIIQIQSYGEKI